jgi:hypothetical protein
LSTGRGFSMVRTGFQRDIGGGSTCGIACLCECPSFRMRAARIRRAAKANDGAILYNHTADAGVRPSTPKPALGKARGMEEEGKVVARDL